MSSSLAHTVLAWTGSCATRTSGACARTGWRGATWRLRCGIACAPTCWGRRAWIWKAPRTARRGRGGPVSYGARDVAVRVCVHIRWRLACAPRGMSFERAWPELAQGAAENATAARPERIDGRRGGGRRRSLHSARTGRPVWRDRGETRYSFVHCENSSRGVDENIRTKQRDSWLRQRRWWEYGIALPR